MSRASHPRNPSHRANPAAASVAARLSVCAAVLCLAAALPAPAQAALQDSAQSPSGSQPSTGPLTRPRPTHRQAGVHFHPLAKQTPPPAPPAADALQAPAPEPPHWPANDRPAPARIVLDSQGLRIEASNASLSEILSEVSTLTGVEVEGFAKDERVYGQYGPGPARDVLAQLLDGTGYNVMMIGSLGTGAPRQLVLTARTAGVPQPAAHPTQSNDDDADIDEPQQPLPAQNPNLPMRGPFNGPGMRNPQFPPDMQRQQNAPGQPYPPPQQGQPQQNQQ